MIEAGFERISEGSLWLGGSPGAFRWRFPNDRAEKVSISAHGTCDPSGTIRARGCRRWALPSKFWSSALGSIGSELSFFLSISCACVRFLARDNAADRHGNCSVRTKPGPHLTKRCRREPVHVPQSLLGSATLGGFRRCLMHRTLPDTFIWHVRFADALSVG